MIIINNASYSNVSVTYTADGTQREFSFPFDYLRKAFVKVEVNEEIILVQGTDYTVSDNKTVVLTEAPESGTIIRVFRETSTTRLVSWADASVLRAKDMTIQQVQNLHILEEQQYWVTENAIIRDGKEWNARNFPIKNVGDPVDSKDATNKEYVDNNFMKLDDNGDCWVGRGKTIRNIEEPIRQSDGATKNYVDHVLAGLSITGDRVQTFNSVALMKEAPLEPGMVAMTTGYYTPNDGGAGVYTIRTKTQSDVDDGGSIIFLDNDNVAELITDGTVNVKQFGAYGDGVTDDTNAFRNAFLVDKLYIPAGNYLITDYLIGFNKVIDDGTYTNIKPIFTTKNRLETISRFGMKANFTTPEDNKMYGEAMTFNTKTQKIIVCCEGFGYSPKKNILLVLNKDTYAIEETYDLPHPYAFNVLSYNEQDNVIYANGGNTCYRINGDDMTDYTTFSLPDNGGHAAHDNITNTDVVVSRDWGTNYNITINVYSNGFAEKLHTVTTKANIIEDTALQDICAYNGKVYVLTFKNLYEIDVVTGDVNIIGISTLQEIEGCTFIDDVFFIFVHQFASNYVEYIYSYQDDYEPQFYNRLLPNYIQRTLDVSLDKFVAMGDYYVDSADTTNKNYPTGETKGYLHVVNKAGVDEDNSQVNSIQEFHSLTAPYSVYQRMYIRDNIGWTPWQKVDHINSTGNGWIRYENGLQLCCGTQEITTGESVSGGYPYRGQAIITFPVPFSSTPCVFSSVNDSINYWISGAKNATVSKFMMMICGNQNNATRESEWYAIGYWK